MQNREIKTKTKNVLPGITQRIRTAWTAAEERSWHAHNGTVNILHAIEFGQAAKPSSSVGLQMNCDAKQLHLLSPGTRSLF